MTALGSVESYLGIFYAGACVFFTTSLILRFELALVTNVTIKAVISGVLKGGRGWMEAAAPSQQSSYPAEDQTRFPSNASPAMKGQLPALLLINYDWCTFPVSL